jgi:hypothetical protein
MYILLFILEMCFDFEVLKIGLYAKPGSIINVQFPNEAVNNLVVSVCYK